MLLFTAEFAGRSKKERLSDLYEKHSRRMFTAAKRILGSERDAEDAVQNAFVSVAKKMDLINDRDDDAMCGYLFAVVKNEAYLILRKRKDTLSAEDLADVPSAADVEIETADRQAYEYAVKLLSEMDEKYRAPLYLTAVMGYSPKEAASLLRREESTVRVQISRAKRILTEKMKEAGYEL